MHNRRNYDLIANSIQIVNEDESEACEAFPVLEETEDMQNLNAQLTTLEQDRKIQFEVE